MMRKNNALGLYLHIPFCRRKCLYCDFYSCAWANGKIPQVYVQRLCEELIRMAPNVGDRTVDTVYFGGGTPSLLSPAQFGQILRTIRHAYRLLPTAEITAECNPGTVSGKAAFAALRETGINRLSIGIQSTCDRELAALGRIHRYQQAKEAVRDARDAGFARLSLDVMYGIPEQTRESFRATLSDLLSLEPEHLSLYSLILEPGTPFYEEQNTLHLPNEDTVCDMTEEALKTLRSAGYERYEISNYARPGEQCRHNLHYWRLDDYLGFGPAAHSLLGNVRTGHRANLPAYLAGEDLTEPEETLTPQETRDEYVMLGLRLTDGIDKHEFYRRFSVSFDDVYGIRLRRYCDMGLAVSTPHSAYLTDAGLAVSNTILSDLMTL